MEVGAAPNPEQVRESGRGNVGFSAKNLDRVVIYLLLVLFLIEVEHGFPLSRPAFGWEVQGKESTRWLFVGEGRTT